MDLTDFYNKFNNISKETLKNYGNERIAEIFIGKHPIQKVIRVAMNAITLGKFDELNNKHYEYDDFMHLFIVLKLYDGSIIKIEKNEHLDVIMMDNDIRDQYINVVFNPNDNLTPLIMLNREYNDVGENAFFKNYHFYNNNCQVFVINFLVSNGFYKDEYITFAYQDLSKIIQNLPNASVWLASNITKLGEYISTLRGKGKGKGSNQGIKHIHKQINQINKFLNDNGTTIEEFIEICNTIPLLGDFF